MKFSAMKPVVLTLILIAVSPLTSSCAGCGVEKIRDVPPPARGASPSLNGAIDDVHVHNRVLAPPACDVGLCALADPSTMRFDDTGRM